MCPGWFRGTFFLILVNFMFGYLVYVFEIYSKKLTPWQIYQQLTWGFP
jgi:hypothetical protein